MTPTLKGILWLVLGPVVSLVLAWFTLWLLGFVLGGGVDIDQRNPPWQQTLLRLALPASGLVFAAGTLFSAFRALICFTTPSDPPS